jgi:hypothetical protein
MKTFPFLAALLAGAVSLAAEPVTFTSSERRTALVELFTSEGCSSCPPADAWVSRLKESRELWMAFVPVVFHVDYWNALGWPDRFSKASFTARQHSYAQSWNSREVYTPEFVLDGREWRNWSQSRTPLGDSRAVGRLQATLTDRQRVEVVFTPVKDAPVPTEVEVALLGGTVVTDVKRGENSGRKLQHDFVALEVVAAPLLAQDGRFVAALSLPKNASETPTALAAWVIVGAARTPLQAVGGWLTVKP